MTDQPGILSRVRIPYADTAQEAAELARAEMEASGLPGEFGGPADAYRHMIWVGEMTRRLGPTAAYGISEFNELRSEIRAVRGAEAGRTVRPANLPDAIAMDRHNNAIGLRIGEQADTADDVIEGARMEILRAGGDGSGHNNRPYWMHQNRWIEPVERSPATNWPFNPAAINDRSHIENYRFRSALHRDYSQDIIDAPGGPIHVRPHLRRGQPVRGHDRSPPAR